MTKRFTIDGSPELETALERRCLQAREAVLAKVPARLIEAIVLGGGYGRGEGGVLKRYTADNQPYNDLEFYVFFRRHRLWQTWRYERMLHETGHRLSSEFGLDVEFKIDCAARWRRGPVSMFSYDLVSGHRVILGDESVFGGCGHHADATAIPLEEATRLMFNRCSGLLLVRALLQKGALTPQETDFAGRNLAKTQLALGDAVVAAHGLYHWSVLKRHQRLVALKATAAVPRLREICSHHERGLDFKLHPFRASESLQQLKAQHRQLADLALCVWLWLESWRLQKPFVSAPDYALSMVDKCPGKSSLRNHFLHWRTFGLKAATKVVSSRYPRSRLFNALALLLWCPDMFAQPAILRRLQEELETSASDWSGLVSVFNRIWPAYG